MFLIWEDIGTREYMEDMISTDCNLPFGFSYYGVFDGHGGSQVSTYLKIHMKETIKTHLLEAALDQSKDIDVPQILYKSIEKTVDDIPYQISTNTGSTAIIILRRRDMVWVANVGDSRAVMNSGHNVIDLTNDHKPMRPDEYRRITLLGGTVKKAFLGDVDRVNGVLALSRAIGDFSLSPHVTWKPEISTNRLHDKNHYIFAATDGVWDVLSSQETVEIINKKLMNNDWKDIGNSIVSQARSRNSGDNIACILIVL
jgi:serine/threonine protein phosphatase PrpC